MVLLACCFLSRKSNSTSRQNLLVSPRRLFNWIQKGDPKVCPKCLAESGYSLRTWDCSLVTACPIHECVLLDTCPDCKRRIKCVRNKLCVCSCGCDWREINS